MTNPNLNPNPNPNPNFNPNPNPNPNPNKVDFMEHDYDDESGSDGNLSD